MYTSVMSLFTPPYAFRMSLDDQTLADNKHFKDLKYAIVSISDAVSNPVLALQVGELRKLKILM